MKTVNLKRAILTATMGMVMATASHAVPVLQIGAPGGSGEGTYANYQASLSNPIETETAITSGAMLYVAGVYQNNGVLSLGGQSGTGSNWSSFPPFSTPTSLSSLFDSKGAIVIVSVADGSLSAAAGLTVGGNTAFYTSQTLSNMFPNNHDPLKDNISDFLFFNIGNFAKNINAVPDFASETGSADGEIKALTVSGFGSLAWAHFDVMTLETSTQGTTQIQTTWENNPGSHDVTWKSEGGGPPPSEIPEPASLAIFGLGLLGLVATSRKSV